jgi:hypothetical protein
MPTSNSAATLALSSGNYNFSTLCAVRRRMSELHDRTILFVFSFIPSILLSVLFLSPPVLLSSLYTAIYLFTSSSMPFLPCGQVFVRTRAGTRM